MAKAAKPSALSALLERKVVPKRDWEAHLPPDAKAAFGDLRARWQARPRRIAAKREEIYQAFCEDYGDIVGASAFFQSLTHKEK